MFRLDHVHDGADAAAQSQVTELLGSCLRSDAWVRAIMAGGPYGDVAALESAALGAARDLDDAALDQALAAHPRIGERPVGTDADAAFSRQEQAAVREALEPGAEPGAGPGAGPAGVPDLAHELAAVNRAYEDRFGRVFIVRAAGRDAAEILAIARSRLTADDATEAVTVREQLGEIAVLRLRTLLAGSAA